MEETEAASKAQLTMATLKVTARSVIVLRTRLANSQISAVDEMTFQRIDRSLTFVTISHADEYKSAGFAAHTISDNVDVRDGAVC
jgi:phosphopantetheinyl transferase (holo-ACP synthase)